jgi:hypothetical protein
VGPATHTLAVTVDAQAHAAAGEGIPVARRGPTRRHGQGNTAGTARLETAGGGLAGRTTDDPYGPLAHGRHAKRRDGAPTPSNAVGVRTGHHREDGPGGNTVFLTTAPVAQPRQPFDDDDRRLIDTCGRQERQQPWRAQHPPQKTARAVPVHVRFTVRRFALATADRLPCAQADRGQEPVGWQRWRRQLLEQARDHVIVFAQDAAGILHRAADSLLWGAHAQRCAAWPWHAPGSPGQRWPHSAWLTLYPNLRSLKTLS